MFTVRPGQHEASTENGSDPKAKGIKPALRPARFPPDLLTLPSPYIQEIHETDDPSIPFQQHTLSETEGY